MSCLAVGGTQSFWASRFGGVLLYQIEPRDPVTLVSAGALPRVPRIAYRSGNCVERVTDLSDQDIRSTW